MSQTLCLSLLVVMNLFWAGSYVVVKLGLESMDPLALIFWRLLLSVAALAVIIAIRRPSLALDRRDLVRIVGAGALLAVSNIFWVTGIDLSFATDASLLYVFEPIWGIFLASFFLREKLRPTALIGLAIVLVGLARLSGFDLAQFGFGGGGRVGIGNLLVVVGLLAESFFSIVLKPVAERRSALVVTAGTLAVTVAILAVPMGIRTGFAPPTAWQPIAAIAFLALICTVVGYTLWVAVMQHMPVSVMFFTVFAQPIAGPAVAALVLNEPIDGRVLTGGALLIAGMAVAVGGHLMQARAGRAAARAAELAAAEAPYVNA